MSERKDIYKNFNNLYWKHPDDALQAETIIDAYDDLIANIQILEARNNTLKAALDEVHTDNHELIALLAVKNKGSNDG